MAASAGSGGGGGWCGRDMAEVLTRWVGLRENMAVKSISVTCECEARGRFSSGAMELGEMERMVRLAVRLVVRLDVGWACCWSIEKGALSCLVVPLRTSSRHWQREPSVQLPQPMLATASSAHAQGPVGSQFPQPVGACSMSSGGLMIWEMENECVVAGRWGAWALSGAVTVLRLDVLALPASCRREGAEGR